MTHNNKPPSQELTELLAELKISISKLKELYKTIDKKAVEEGFSIEEVYEIANVTDVKLKSIATMPDDNNNQKTTNTTTNNNNNTNEEKKYFQRYFQHFQ